MNDSHNSTPTFSPDAGYAVVGAASGGSGSGKRSLTPVFTLLTASGSYAASGTLSAAQQWRAAAVTYHP